MIVKQLWKELSDRLISLFGDLLLADIKKKYDTAWYIIFS
jgi:hypothetical protein